jgi:flavin reductase (DIM6/NTAB) family NADH-FMN oxidoreductase RutF
MHRWQSTRRARHVLGDPHMTQPVADFMQTISTGVYVIGVSDGQRANAFTASSVMPVSFKPVMVVFGVGMDHASRPLLHAGKSFTINVLKSDQIELARHFGSVSGRDADKLAGIRWRPGLQGAPILVDALSCIECARLAMVPAGDHELVLGEVLGGGILARDASPLLYRDTHNLDGARALYPAQLSEGVRVNPFTVRC